MKLALVDVETTGGKPINDRVIDIGIVLVDDNQIVYEWESLINPECAINPFITQLTGISDVLVSTAPTFADVHHIVNDLLVDRIFVAHNAGFDYSFIKHEFSRLNVPFQAPRLCTVKLSRLFNPQERHHNLDSLLERFHITIENRHRALPDAKALYYFLENWRQLHGSQTMEEKIKAITKRPALPPNVSLDLIQKLSSSVGVYTFFNQEGIPLYIGKSVNIKERVLSHFYADSDSTKEMLINQEVRFIEGYETAGELEALLLESKLVKEMQPIYNRKLRKTRGLWVVKKHQDKHGYYRLSIENIENISYPDHDSIELIGKSKRQLNKQLKDMCDINSLCPKLCGLEQGSGACFNYHLDRCNGACVHTETSASYNQRLLETFASSAIIDWPYDGPIIIHEHNDQMDKDAFHLIHNWSVLSTASTLEDIQLTSTGKDLYIDLDEYIILKNYITKSSHRGNIINIDTTSFMFIE